MPAQLEEVIRQANTFNPQHIGPDRGDLLLQRGHRFNPHPLGLSRLRLRQALAVQLAIGGQWHLRQEHEVRWHHVVRQAGFQGATQRFAEFDLGRGVLGQQRVCRNHIGDQLLARWAFLSDYDGFTDAVLFTQARFDFTQLDTETANFHLMVDATKVIHHAIRTATGQVAAAIHATARFAEWIRHKTFRGKCRTLQVPPGYALAAQVQLARHANGLQVELRVQNIAAAIAQ
ncbi:hypothetical protein [Pseudomonas sp. 35 E 8]|nr:hypothetical protein [Pseudomonas sp. 35 E 8]